MCSLFLVFLVSLVLCARGPARPSHSLPLLPQGGGTGRTGNRRGEKRRPSPCAPRSRGFRPVPSLGTRGRGAPNRRAPQAGRPVLVHGPHHRRGALCTFPAWIGTRAPRMRRAPRTGARPGTRRPNRRGAQGAPQAPNRGTVEGGEVRPCAPRRFAPRTRRRERGARLWGILARPRRFQAEQGARVAPTKTGARLE